MKILLVQTAFLGDIVLSTAIIGAIREQYPDSELWFLTTVQGEQIVRHDPRLSGVITFDKRRTERGVKGMLAKSRELRRHQFDIVYSLHKSFRTALLLYLSGIVKRIGFRVGFGRFLYSEQREFPDYSHSVSRNLSILGISEMDSKKYDLEVFPGREAELSEPVKNLLKERYVLLVPGSAWHTKRWHWENYRETAQELLKLGFRVVLTGAPAEDNLCSKISSGIDVDNLGGNEPLGSMISLVKHAQAVVCNDSMVLHLASALKRPNVAIFCATSPTFGFGPWNNPSAQVVEKKELTCKPCSRHGTRHCPLGTEECMRDLRPEVVLAGLKDVIARGCS